MKAFFGCMYFAALRPEESWIYGKNTSSAFLRMDGERCD
jgi:hypothetical protein